MRMTIRLVRPLLVLAVICTAGCASSAASRFYTLSPEAVPGAGAAPDFAVVIGPIEMAEYLNRPQIVTRSGGTMLEIAEFDRWAEPLEKNILRTVTANVRSILNTDRVYEFPIRKMISNDYRVTARIGRFDSDNTGLAVLEVQWAVFDIEKERIVDGPHVSRYEESTGGGGFAEITTALNRTLTRFSGDITGALRSLPSN